MSQSRTTVELWTDWECNSGTRLGRLTVVSGTWGEEVDGSDQCDLVIIPTSRATPALRQVVRITNEAGTVWEYRVQFLGRTLDKRTRVLRGASPLLDLGTAGPIRQQVGASTTFRIGGTKTATDFINDDILTNLAADGLSWLSLGTVDPTAVGVIESTNVVTQRLKFLRTMEDAFTSEVRLRRNGGTGYYLDFLTRIGASGTTVRVVQGKNLLSLQETQDDGELATAIMVRGGAATVTDGSVVYFSSIGENAWTVGTIPGSAPYWIPLTDPDGGANPIVFDNQVDNYYLLLKDGTLLQITDSRESDSAVLVAATTGLTAGDLVQIVKDSSATRLWELTNPNAARLFRLDEFLEFRGWRNLALNGLFKRGASDYAIADWTNSIDAGRFPRTGATTSYSMTGGNNSIPGTTLTITSGPANLIIYKGELLSINNLIRVAATTQLDGSGAGTITMDSNVTVANGTTITQNTNPTFIDDRLSTFTDDNTGDTPVVFMPAETNTTWPHTTGTHYAYPGLHSSTYTVKYVAGGGVSEYINASAGFTVKNAWASPLTNEDSGGATDVATGVIVRRLPAIRIDKPSTTTILASSLAAVSVPANSQSDYVVSCNALLTADTDVRVSVYGGAAPSGQQRTYLRYVSMWISATAAGGAGSPPVGDQPSANILWHRTNRALLARGLRTVNVTVSLVDLSRLAGYSITRETITLGANIQLADIQLTARVMAIRYDVLNPANTQVTIDSRPTRLVKFLAERV